MKVMIKNMNINLVNNNITMHKIEKKQMSSTSVCNLLPHMLYVSYSNFLPQPNLSDGCHSGGKISQELLHVIKKLLNHISVQ